MAGRRAKPSEIWAAGMSIQCIYRILVKLNGSGSSGGHSVYFKNLVPRKRQVLE